MAMKSRVLRTGLTAITLSLAGMTASAQTILEDNFTGTSSNLSWTPFNGACLTAGSGAGTIPACRGLSYYGNQTQQGLRNNADTAGNGALRFTNAGNNQNGAIITTRPYPSNQGVQVTFTTYTYGGDNSGGHGADGIGFYLINNDLLTATGPYSGKEIYNAGIGSWGGSLGYSCSNSNVDYHGMIGGYLGLGMDEFGNFLTQSDNTATGFGYQPGRIGMRGAGNVHWSWLHANFPQYYPSTLSSSAQTGAVQKTCSTGNLWDYSIANPKSITGLTVSGTTATVTVSNHNYVNGDTVQIASVMDAWPTQSITGATSNGNTVTLTVPSHGYVNGNTVSLGGTITATIPDVSSIKTATPSGSGNSYTVTIVTKTANDFKVGDSITLSGLKNGNNNTLTNTYAVATVRNNTTFTLNVTSNPGSSITVGANASATDITKSNAQSSITGSYQVSGVGSNTFNITLSTTPTSVTNTVGTVILTTPAPANINGSYRISGVTQNTFQISLGSATGNINYDSGTATNQSSTARNTNIAVADYAPIPNGANPNGSVTLPTSTPIANEAATTRANATPITYKLQITSDGKLSLWYSYNNGTPVPVLSKQDITANNGPLPSNFLFGFGASTGGSTNVHEVSCFKVTPANQAASSAGINTQQAGQVKTGTQVFTAFYNPENWWGNLQAQSLLVNTSTGAVSISPTANWDSACVLTGGLAAGGTCPATGQTGMTAQGPNQRTLLTWSGSAGIPLGWDSLTATEQGWLNAGDNNGQARLAYLSGERANEVGYTPAGSLPNTFRNRFSVLGDIIDSSPTWVGAPASPYKLSWMDNLYPSATMPENQGTQTYTDFMSAYANRLNVIYTGANDGFLHAVRAGSYDSNGNYVDNGTTPNDGHEVLAYMPQTVLQTIHNAVNTQLDYSSSNYAHNYFTDATPGTGDLFYGGAWHTWLAGGLGQGGSAFFILDITNPSNFSTANANNLVVGEWNASNPLPCGVNASAKCAASLGNIYGMPQIRRLHNGQWGIIFGNGLNTPDGGDAGIYVMTINANGRPSTVYFLDTGLASPAGIAAVTPVDLDGDHITDYVYAGDSAGNVWRFDLTSNNPANWKVSTFAQDNPTPLFSTPNGQPITSQVLAFSAVQQPQSNVDPSQITPDPGLSEVVPNTGLPRILIEFGTGSVTPQTNTDSAQYAQGQQSLYGIFDWDLGKSGTPNSGWNAISRTPYASLTGSLTAPTSIALSNLQQQSVTSVTSAAQSGSGLGSRTVSSTPVLYAGTSYSVIPNNKQVSVNSPVAGSQFGWYLNLPGYLGVTGVATTNQTEQVVYDPVNVAGALVVNTSVPPNNTPLTCSVQLAQGWTMALNPVTGGAFSTSFFANSTGQVINLNGTVISGIALNATGRPSVVSVSNQKYVVNQTQSGVPIINKVNPPGAHLGKRVTWVQVR